MSPTVASMNSNHVYNNCSEDKAELQKELLRIERPGALELTDDTTCGIWIFKGRTLQKFANKKAYVCLYGLLGCVYAACYAYFNGTITTLEKRFKIPSRTTG